MTILTVFANDPDDDRPAREWDAQAGFGTAAEAAGSRREEDRRRVVEILGGRIDAPRVGRFVEQPYAALWTAGPDDGEWRTLAASLRDQAAKLRASRAYGSQLPLLGEHVLRRAARYELLRGGEAVSWITR